MSNKLVYSAVDNIPIEIEDLLKIIDSDVDDGPWIAGGCPLSIFTKNPINDVDVYTINEKQKDELGKKLIAFGFQAVCISKNALTLKKDGLPSVQLIEKHYRSVDNLFNSFDISVCQIVMHNMLIAAHKETLNDIKQKRLIINFRQIENNYSTLMRIFKYCNKGYRVELDDAQKNIERLLYETLSLTEKELSHSRIISEIMGKGSKS